MTLRLPPLALGTSEENVCVSVGVVVAGSVSRLNPLIPAPVPVYVKVCPVTTLGTVTFFTIIDPNTTAAADNETRWPPPAAPDVR